MTEFEDQLRDMAERAYTAYREDAKAQSYNGRPIPVWFDVNPKIQRHWLKAVEAITRPAPDPATEAVNESLNRRPARKTIGQLTKRGATE